MAAPASRALSINSSIAVAALRYPSSLIDRTKACATISSSVPSSDGRPATYSCCAVDFACVGELHDDSLSWLVERDSYGEVMSSG